MKKLVIIGLLAATLVSCHLLDKPEAESALARVEDRYLYPSDLESLFNADMTAEDSLRVINEYVNFWIREQLLLLKADRNLSEQEKDISDMVERYKNSLIRNIYEQKVINQYLDTNITSASIALYYEENKDNFVLTENIFQVLYVKSDVNAPKLDKLKDLMKKFSGDPSDLIDHCMQYCLETNFNDTSWFTFRDLTKMLPQNALDDSGEWKRQAIYEYVDGSYIYLIRVLKERRENSFSPLEFVSETIRNVLIYQRKLELIKDLEQKLYKDAEQKGRFEIYTP